MVFTVQAPGRQDGPKKSDKDLMYFSKSVPSLEQMLTEFLLSTVFSNSCKSNGVMSSLYLKPGWQYFFLCKPAIPPL